MTALAAIIRAEIDRHGAIGVDRYMELCLSHPEHGYYFRKDPLGRQGDFITAPEITQMFGELAGLWLINQYHQQGLGEAMLAELGPGRGTLMADALRAIAATGTPALPVHLVEINPVLKARQHDRLADTARAGLNWHNTPDGLPAQPMLLVANEFFDALPCRRLSARDGRWHEIMIHHDGSAFIEQVANTPADIDLPPAEDGTIAEISEATAVIAHHLGARIAQHGGAALIIDYGKDTPIGDTLQAVRDHGKAPVFDHPGEADLSAWVDFSAIRRAAENAGAAVLGPVEQGEFLRAIGLHARAEQLAQHATSDQRRQLLAAVERLTGSAHMGSAFKVMAIVPTAAIPVAGF